jgi:TRAP-type mannitol/chloroaromatic compound transport system substrate-binding protein
MKKNDERMPMITRRTLARSGVMGLAGAFAAPSIARGETQRWRMVTSWPRRLPGPGMSAERVAERISTLSGGRLQVTVHAAGEIVPAFEVLDAVGSGVAEMGHTAAFFWQGKQPASVFYTTVPFGLTPQEHVAWVDAGGGQALWDELYAPFGAKPFMAGNTGVCMGGWFRHELRGVDDLKGLKIRSLGLGGEVYRRLGAVAQTTSPGEILTSMQSGLIDGAEFVGPGSDIALGLYRVATFYYAPGFNKPNGTGECILSLRAWEALDSQMKAIVQHACAAEAAFALAEMERLNVEALPALSGQHGVKLQIFPQSLILAARAEASSVVGEVGTKSAIARKIYDSYVSFRDRSSTWSRVSIKAVLEAREG